MTLRTRRQGLLGHLVLGDLVSLAIDWGTGPVLTSDLAYPATLIPSLFGLGRGC